MPLPWLIAGGLAAAATAAAVALSDDPKENKQDSKDHARKELAPDFVREGVGKDIETFKADLGEISAWYAGFDKEMREDVLDKEIIKKLEKFHETILENKGTLDYRKKQRDEFPNDVYFIGLVEEMEDLFDAE